MAVLVLILLSFTFLPTMIYSQTKYNLIDPSPRCYTTGFCTAYGKPGAENSIHPNSEEKVQRLMYNIARTTPDEYITSKYGKYMYGTYGPTTSYHDDGGKCGNAVEKPYYWYSDANQVTTLSPPRLPSLSKRTRPLFLLSFFA